MKNIRGRLRANQDIYDIAESYKNENLILAGRFAAQLREITSRIEVMPGLGSQRFARELGMDGLRAYPLGDFPYILLYFEREDHIDLVRVLHMHRDIFDLLLGTE